MPSTLSEPQRPLPAPAALTEVLAQTIFNNAQMLRLLDPERYQELLKTLPVTTKSTSPDSNLEEAWEDLERWMQEYRQQDQAAVGL